MGRASPRGSATCAGGFDDARDVRRSSASGSAQLDDERGTSGNALFYLATPPTTFPTIVAGLGDAGLSHEDDGHFRRVVIEKPFGRDLGSAIALNHQVHEAFEESQVFRIDHYLGKETVQNILVLRFANGIFEPVWNRNFVDHVQITVAESIGVEGRGRFYEEAGALRDIVQNHLLQVLSFVAMEPPASFEAEAVRDERAKVLGARAADAHHGRRARPVRGRLQRGRARAGLRRGGGRRAELRDRDVRRRARCRSTTGAGPTRRSTCAPASGCRSA